jgi:2'-5' RNA ligase
MSAPTVAPSAVDTDLPTGWRGPILPLNTRSGDGREFVLTDGTEPGIRPLPLPLSAQEKLANGHDGSIVVGLITRAWAQDGYLWAEGPFDLHDEKAREWAAKVGRGNAGWVSSDIFDVTVEQVPLDRDGGEIALTAVEAVEPVSILYRVPSWRLGGVTLVSSPAFGDVRIEPVYGEQFTSVHAQDAITAAAAQHTGAMVALIPSDEDCARLTVDGYEPAEVLHTTLAFLGEAAAWAPEHRDALEQAIRAFDFTVPLAGSIMGHAQFNPAGDEPCAVYLVEAQGLSAMHTMVYGAIADNMDLPLIPEPYDSFVPHITAGYGLAASELTEVGPIRYDRIRLSFADTDVRDIELEPVTSGLVAAGILYDATDFDQPEPDEPVGLTITDDGRVYGHLAAWGSCHIGFPDVCITPPEYENNDYHFFHQGYAPTTDGLIPVGKITYRTGHAGLRMHAQAAAAHYDNTGAVAAVVRCQDGVHGPWLSGRLVPGLDDAAIAEIQRSGVSGDWRELRETRNAPKRMELVAALSVNVPGFPRPRPKALAASGYKTLIAAGALAPNIERKPHDTNTVQLTPEDRRQVQFFSLAEFNAKVASEVRASRVRETAGEKLAARVRATRVDAATRRVALVAAGKPTHRQSRVNALTARMIAITAAGKARRVETPAGAKHYGQPVGSIIVTDGPDEASPDPPPDSLINPDDDEYIDDIAALYASSLYFRIDDQDEYTDDLSRRLSGADLPTKGPEGAAYMAALQERIDAQRQPVPEWPGPALPPPSEEEFGEVTQSWRYASFYDNVDTWRDDARALQVSGWDGTDWAGYEGGDWENSSGPPIGPMLGQIANTPATVQPIHRGMAVTPEYLAQMATDAQFTMGLSSFTGDEGIATRFASSPGDSSQGRHADVGADATIPIVLTVEPGARAASLGHNSFEHVTLGQFTVLGRTERDGITYVTVRQTSPLEAQ